MRNIVVDQTSQRRFVAKVLGTDVVGKGTSLPFAIGQLVIEHGYKYGLNVVLGSDAWVKALRDPTTRCAFPISECATEIEEDNDEPK